MRKWGGLRLCLWLWWRFDWGTETELLVWLPCIPFGAEVLLRCVQCLHENRKEHRKMGLSQKLSEPNIQ